VIFGIPRGHPDGLFELELVVDIRDEPIRKIADY
jgi:hypothetical protein